MRKLKTYPYLGHIWHQGHFGHYKRKMCAKVKIVYFLFFKVQAATKPSFATFFPSVLQAPDWTPPFDLECEIAAYALGTSWYLRNGKVLWVVHENPKNPQNENMSTKRNR
ncbi:hypothetical protein Lal_00032007 [Lupinus albus]|nr:hypothetical protein Lal_00032007 [Lupinus albus]